MLLQWRQVQCGDKQRSEGGVTYLGRPYDCWTGRHPRSLDAKRLSRHPLPRAHFFSDSVGCRKRFRSTNRGRGGRNGDLLCMRPTGCESKGLLLRRNNERPQLQFGGDQDIQPLVQFDG